MSAEPTAQGNRRVVHNYPPDDGRGLGATVDTHAGTVLLKLGRKWDIMVRDKMKEEDSEHLLKIMQHDLFLTLVAEFYRWKPKNKGYDLPSYIAFQYEEAARYFDDRAATGAYDFSRKTRSEWIEVLFTCRRRGDWKVILDTALKKAPKESAEAAKSRTDELEAVKQSMTPDAVREAWTSAVNDTINDNSNTATPEAIELFKSRMLSEEEVQALQELAVFCATTHLNVVDQIEFIIKAWFYLNGTGLPVISPPAYPLPAYKDRHIAISKSVLSSINSSVMSQEEKAASVLYITKRFSPKQWMEAFSTYVKRFTPLTEYAMLATAPQLKCIIEARTDAFYKAWNEDNLKKKNKFAGAYEQDPFNPYRLALFAEKFDVDEEAFRTCEISTAAVVRQSAEEPEADACVMIKMKKLDDAEVKEGWKRGFKWVLDTHSSTQEERDRKRDATQRALRYMNNLTKDELAAYKDRVRVSLVYSHCALQLGAWDIVVDWIKANMNGEEYVFEEGRFGFVEYTRKRTEIDKLTFNKIVEAIGPSDRYKYLTSFGRWKDIVAVAVFDWHRPKAEVTLLDSEAVARRRAKQFVDAFVTTHPWGTMLHDGLLSTEKPVVNRDGTFGDYIREPLINYTVETITAESVLALQNEPIVVQPRVNIMQMEQGDVDETIKSSWVQTFDAIIRPLEGKESQTKISRLLKLRNDRYENGNPMPPAEWDAIKRFWTLWTENVLDGSPILALVTRWIEVNQRKDSDKDPLYHFTAIVDAYEAINTATFDAVAEQLRDSVDVEALRSAIWKHVPGPNELSRAVTSAKDVGESRADVFVVLWCGVGLSKRGMRELIVDRRRKEEQGESTLEEEQEMQKIVIKFADLDLKATGNGPAPAQALDTVIEATKDEYDLQRLKAIRQQKGSKGVYARPVTTGTERSFVVVVDGGIPIVVTYVPDENKLSFAVFIKKDNVVGLRVVGDWSSDTKELKVNRNYRDLTKRLETAKAAVLDIMKDPWKVGSNYGYHVRGDSTAANDEFKRLREGTGTKPQDAGLVGFLGVFTRPSFATHAGARNEQRAQDSKLADMFRFKMRV